MTDLADYVVEPMSTKRQRRNWWKVAFFVVLLGFEFTREFAVVSFEETRLVSAKTVSHFKGLVRAKGVWQRADTGSPLVPTAVNIVCSKYTRVCTEASVTVMDGEVMPPELNFFRSTYTDGAVVYTHDDAACVRYSVRIDWALEQAFALRELKEDATSSVCDVAERRTQMRLVGSHEIKRDMMDGHFVPLLRLTQAVYKLL